MEKSRSYPQYSSEFESETENGSNPYSFNGPSTKERRGLLLTTCSPQKVNSKHLLEGVSSGSRPNLMIFVCNNLLKSLFFYVIKLRSRFTCTFFKCRTPTRC
ncbi:hypothetical protein ACJIZ3_002799 [Penstemon smallii]|uniref:Uncharacterized protein n=1 Tax=Penstemon smallii TaxID=265156 RepID=A0ABD3U8Y9_9LAMI